MKSKKSTKEAIKQWLNVSASPETRDRIWREVFFVQEQTGGTKSTLIRPDIWRTIMKSPITKLTATMVIIIAVLFLITFFDKVAASAYALEQTIEANHTIKTVHLRMFEDVESIKNNEFSDYWLKYDDAGKLSNLRWNSYDDYGDAFSVWNDGILKTWMPEKNVVFIIRLNHMDKKWEDFAEECDPKLFLQRLYNLSKEKEEIELKIDEPADDSDSIYVKTTHSFTKQRAELVVDRQTKLIKKFSIYHLREHGDEFDMQVEYLAYNQPIDPSMFELRGIPDNAKIYDQVNQLVGLEKGDLVNKEIAAKVVREGLEATIAKDYDEASRLMEGDPGDVIEEFIEKEFEAGLVRVVSIGQPEEHEKYKQALFVPCEIEVENEERGRWTVNITALATAIEYQDDRWIMQSHFRFSEPYLSSIGALNEQDRIEGNIIVPGLRVGDYYLGISKDEVLRKLGEPKDIFWGGKEYTLDNLPTRYFMSFDEDISFKIEDDTVTEIGVDSPLYRFNNGLGVGDSEQKIKQAFGDDFHLKEGRVKDFLTYEDKGLKFEIYTMNRMVVEIGIYQPTGDNGDSDTPDSGNVRMLSEQPPGPIIFPKIDKHVIPEPWHRGALNELPPSISEDFFQIDLRSYNLSSLDLRNSLYELLHSEFDSSTVWPAPDKMPKGFDLNKIMKYGKNPGLNVKSLHNQGITGKNMGIAIIDQVLLTGHEEYRDRLRFYEEIHVFEHKTGADSHASGVASVAAGTSIGVAPEADLYFIGCYFWEWENHSKVLDFKYIAQAVRRVIAINRQLPNDRKIQAISISRGFDDTHKGYDEIVAACYEAKAEGLFVVCANIELLYNNFDFHALGRDPLGNPNDFNSYIPGNWWEQVFYKYPDRFKNEVLLVPSGSRVNALDTDHDHYEFSVGGGLSSVVPYVAGLYVLAKQVNSEITPEQFCSKALQTGRTIQLRHKEKTYSFGKIVDPVSLINAIQSVSDNQHIQTHPQTHSKAQTIVPGVRVGDYTFDMSKDDVLNKLGEPESIRIGGQRYTLNDLPDNLPRRYIMSFSDFSFAINDDSVKVITVRSPLYKFTNGLGVGDSEQKIKRAFGNDFQLEEYEWKDLLNYEDKGIQFEIHKKNRTIMEINVYQPTVDQSDSDTTDSRKVIMLSEQSPGPITFPKIDHKPKPEMAEPREMNTLPKYDPDFQVQGEYVGTIGGVLPVGVQVIALGKHEFEGVFFTGGLPG
ncbi:MAG: S8 family serine peptidase, partial [Planctomycetota bacterium]